MHGQVWSLYLYFDILSPSSDVVSIIIKRGCLFVLQFAHVRYFRNIIERVTGTRKVVSSSPSKGFDFLRAYFTLEETYIYFYEIFILMLFVCLLYRKRKHSCIGLFVNNASLIIVIIDIIID